MTDAKLPSRRRVVLTGISSRAWEHPADRGALTALRELRGFDDILKTLSAAWAERALRVEFLGSAIRVDHRQYPRIHRLFAEAAASLDVSDLPELYIRNDRSLNAMCIGMAKPFIVVNSGAVELLDEDELRALLGHELGHLLSGHALYRTIAQILTGLAVRFSWLPIGSLVLRAIVVALQEWWRKAELSADRAGLLAGQDPAASQRLLMKLAGGGDLSEVDTTAFLEQAAEYERSGDLRESLIKLQLVASSTHPLPVARAVELRRWIDDGAYQQIIAGDYPRRADDDSASVSAEARAAAASYRASFARSEDPLFSLLRRISDGAGGVGEWVGNRAERMRRWVAGDAPYTEPPAESTQPASNGPTTGAAAGEPPTGPTS